MCIILTSILKVLLLLVRIITSVYTKTIAPSDYRPYYITKHCNLWHHYTTFSLWNKQTYTKTMYYTISTHNTV